MSNREKLQYTLTFFADLVSLLFSTAFTWLVFGSILHVIPNYVHLERVHFYSLLSAAFLIAFLCFDQTENITKRGWQGELRLSVLFNMIMLAILATLLTLTKATMADSRYLIMGTCLFNILSMLLLHQLLKAYLNKPDTIHRLATLAGVISTTDRIENLLAGLDKDWTKSVHGIALLDGEQKSVGTEIHGIPVVAVGLNFMDWVRRDSLDEVYIKVPYDSGTSFMPMLTELESMGITIHLNIPILEKLHANKNEDDAAWYPHLAKSVEEYNGISLIALKATQRSFSDTIIKRLIDIVGSLVGLIISIPIIAITAIPLKIESPGPLFFKQKRVGLNGRIFYIYKLRSMYMNAEERKKELMAKNEMNGLMFKITDDPRITKVGKFIRKTSIDELPQLFNIHGGSLSIVGDRVIIGATKKTAKLCGFSMA